MEKLKDFPSDESIRKAMELAWTDHHHARNQTWKTVQMVAVLGAGLLTIDFKYENFWATLSAAILVIVISVFGIFITWHHRKLERRKFIHIMNCEEMLRLHRDDLIPLHPGDDSIKSKPIEVQDSAVKVPEKFNIWDVVSFCKHNTALFILRMHCAILVFAILIVIMRYISSRQQL